MLRFPGSRLALRNAAGQVSAERDCAASHRQGIPSDISGRICFLPIFFSRRVFSSRLSLQTSINPSSSAAADTTAGPATHATAGWQQAVAATVGGLGFELVDLERSAGGLLRVTIDREPASPSGAASDDTPTITVDDCEAVTRQLQYLLEVENVDYARLEVSSPGLDRPLKTAAHYRRFIGAAVEVTLKAPLQGRKRYRGVLAAIQGASGDGAAPRPDAPAWRLWLDDSLGAAPAKPVKVGQRGAAARKNVAAGSQPTLDFSLDEVREARLVPVVDFKGRASRPATQPAGQGEHEQ